MAQKITQPTAYRAKTATTAKSRARVSVPQHPKLPPRLSSVWSLSRTSARLLWRHHRLFVGIALVYAFLTLLLVGLASNSDIINLKQQLNQSFTGHLGTLASSLTVLVSLLGSSSSNASAAAGTYQFFLGLIASLAIIWALRQVIAGAAVRIRDSYYQGMYPLVPFVLVLLVIGLQLLPLLIGAAIYSQVISSGIAVLMVEKLAWALVFGLLSLLSLYLVSSSIFALYIVTLPGMTPVKALRSARQLVRNRRWTVLRKLLFLPFGLLVITTVIMLPIIVWLTALSQWMFFALTMLSLVVIHGYLYSLYRELINE